MKKIKIIAALALVLCGLSSISSAQTSEKTTLHVIIKDIMSLTVNQPDVTLIFDTPADYTDGVETDVENHLTVSSTRAFDITVQSAADDLVDGVNSIAVGSVMAEVLKGENGLGKTPLNQPLSMKPITIVAGAPAQVSRDIAIRYHIPSLVSNSTAILGKPSGDYTASLTYTIAAN